MDKVKSPCAVCDGKDDRIVRPSCASGAQDWGAFSRFLPNPHWHVAHCAACMRLVPTFTECISMHPLGANREANIDSLLAWHRREAVARFVSPQLSLLTFLSLWAAFGFPSPHHTAVFRSGARRLPGERGWECGCLSPERCPPCRLPARYPDDGGWGERERRRSLGTSYRTANSQ